MVMNNVSSCWGHSPSTTAPHRGLSCNESRQVLTDTCSDPGLRVLVLGINIRLNQRRPFIGFEQRTRSKGVDDLHVGTPVDDRVE